jgi:hypothetical protein
MRRRQGGKLLTLRIKHFCIVIGAFALLLLAACLCWGGAGRKLAGVAYASEAASSGVGDTLRMIGAKFGLSESVYRSTKRGDALLVLALACSGVVAFNLWFFRHLHCVYAPRGKA